MPSIILFHHIAYKYLTVLYIQEIKRRHLEWLLAKVEILSKISKYFSLQKLRAKQYKQGSIKTVMLNKNNKTHFRFPSISPY